MEPSLVKSIGRSSNATILVYSLSVAGVNSGYFSIRVSFSCSWPILRHTRKSGDLGSRSDGDSATEISSDSYFV